MAAEWHRPAFVGRHEEMALLMGLLEQAGSGVPSLVLLEGQAGIGKTALVRTFLELAGPIDVMRASGEEAEQRLAFGVFGQLMSAATTLLDAESRPPWRAGSNAPDDPLLAGSALLDVIGELGQALPVVVVIDDAHWADRPSLVALTFALRRLSADKAMAIVVTREVSDDRLPAGLTRVLAGSDTTHLSLKGLSSDDIRGLSAALGDAALDRSAAARLHEHTGGNPLHARALLEQLPHDVLRDIHVPLPAPRSYALLVLGKLKGCTEEAQALLGAASVLGRRCPVQIAAALADVEDPMPATDEACRAGLFVQHSAPLDLEFPHPLVHAAVYEHLGVRRRATLHLRATELCNDEADRLWHRVLAATGPDLALVGDLIVAGQSAMVRGDWSTASQHLSGAARLAPQREDREQRRLEALECQLISGDTPDFDLLVGQLRTFEATSWRSYVLARVALAEGRLDMAESWLADAWDRCDLDTEITLGGRIAGQLAWVYVARDRGADAVASCETAMRLAGSGGTTDVSSLIRLVAYGMTGRSREALRSLATLPSPSVASVAELDALLGRARLRSWTDDLQGAYDDLTGVLDAVHGRSITFRVLTRAILGEVEYFLGRWDDSLLHSSSAASLAVDVEQGWLTSICESNAALVQAARGEWDQAEAHLEAAEVNIVHPGHVTAASYVASARAHLAAARNNPTQVTSALWPLVLHDHSRSTFEPGVIVRWQDILVDALVANGDFRDADAILSRFEARAGERQHHSSLAAAARARGTFLSARRDLEGAAVAFDWAHIVAEQLDMPFDRARLWLAHGESLRRAGKRTAAASQLERARSTFERLGAGPYLSRCTRELAACGTKDATLGGPARVNLTPQEFAVGRLVAQGLSNRQIARELVISVKTVEYHLSHAYQKLQISSRVQLGLKLAKT